VVGTAVGSGNDDSDDDDYYYYYYSSLNLALITYVICKALVCVSVSLFCTRVH
jgi:hypothetical protein